MCDVRRRTVRVAQQKKPMQSTNLSTGYQQDPRPRRTGGFWNHAVNISQAVVDVESSGFPDGVLELTRCPLPFCRLSAYSTYKILPFFLNRHRPRERCRQ
jgi:hypothetical protein